MIHRVKLPALLAGLTLSALAVGCSTSDGAAATPSPLSCAGGATRGKFDHGSEATTATDEEQHERIGKAQAAMIEHALLQTDNPLGVLPTTEKFNRSGAGPIKGVWAKPA